MVNMEYTSAMEKKYITTTELAKLLGISHVAVFKKIKRGQIKAEKFGRIFLIDRENLPEILDTKLSAGEKKEIEKAVEKTVKEYGETIKLLGKE
jgi:excisionase family DNA binding protein